MISFKNIFAKWRLRKFTLKFVYSEKYWMVNLNHHVFPVEKYRLLYEKLIRLGAKKANFLPPQPAINEELLLVHTAKYLNKLQAGKLSQSEILTMELPYSPQLLEFALCQVGGTVLAAETALQEGLAVHLGGGFHHAFPDHGEGFCVVNDVAVALEKMKREGKIEKGMIIDCDVHQGNGTASIFDKKDYAFTFSIHQMDIYPAQKPSSSLDVGLWSGDGDDKYLTALKAHIPRIYQEFKPDIIFYLAGADPYQNDQLGGLKLTMEGLKERDKWVVGQARELGLPLVILLAGGYAYDVEETVTIHFNTIQLAQKIHRKRKQPALVKD